VDKQRASTPFILAVWRLVDALPSVSTAYGSVVFSELMLLNQMIAQIAVGGKPGIQTDQPCLMLNGGRNNQAISRIAMMLWQVCRRHCNWSRNRQTDNP
jgi:hypothetical protein